MILAEFSPYFLPKNSHRVWKESTWNHLNQILLKIQSLREQEGFTTVIRVDAANALAMEFQIDGDIHSIFVICDEIIDER